MGVSHPGPLAFSDLRVVRRGGTGCSFNCGDPEFTTYELAVGRGVVRNLNGRVGSVLRVASAGLSAAYCLVTWSFLPLAQQM
ncbi:hypothetical protein GCM10017673_35510 [Streptosporangium violaceochromogenes]|nr:hypothetical protein GCM10017673_35510 [Streptosporangium violaceochromogenes]